MFPPPSSPPRRVVHPARPSHPWRCETRRAAAAVGGLGDATVTLFGRRPKTRRAGGEEVVGAFVVWMLLIRTVPAARGPSATRMAYVRACTRPPLYPPLGRTNGRRQRFFPATKTVGAADPFLWGNCRPSRVARCWQMARHVRARYTRRSGARSRIPMVPKRSVAAARRFHRRPYGAASPSRSTTTYAIFHLMLFFLRSQVVVVSSVILFAFTLEFLRNATV